ncbi:carbohydrate ABC transporter permease [Embleya hyalina]|uniref:Sugar ABC transporter permease n=1 Tax=Embleya hyalina TaxID=516124 RepID=A0A401YEJ6_9ACTN|nr:sugar ABC transporter permease [Embleya hyalina]GCD92988.1 sugar ABC transporter permease [Embleya hyalina]
MSGLRAWSARQYWPAFFYLLPAAVFYTLFVLRPLGQTAWVSLFTWDGITEGRWVGADNYSALLDDGRIPSAIAHSLVFVVFYAVFPVALGLFLAALMSRIRVRGLSFFRAVLFLPQILATVVVAVSWRWIYDIDGPLNAGLRAVGLGSLARAWLGDYDTALPAVGIVGTWVMYGLCMVLFLAGVQKIPTELYESARLDGCGPIREFFTVTLPALRGEIAIALVLTITYALRNFDLVWNTTAGGPGTSTTVPSVFVYQGAFLTHEVGSAAAISVCLTAVVLVVTGVIMRLVRGKEG